MRFHHSTPSAKMVLEAIESNIHLSGWFAQMFSEDGFAVYFWGMLPVWVFLSEDKKSVRVYSGQELSVKGKAFAEKILSNRDIFLLSDQVSLVEIKKLKPILQELLLDSSSKATHAILSGASFSINGELDANILFSNLKLFACSCLRDGLLLLHGE